MAGRLAPMLLSGFNHGQFRENRDQMAGLRLRFFPPKGLKLPNPSMLPKPDRLVNIEWPEAMS